MDVPENESVKADLFLLHAPSVYDFRDREDVLFAYLSDSDSVNVTSIYEMYPLGFLSIKEQLHQHDLQVEIVNIASLMLMYPQLDVDKLLGQLEAPIFGFDLHWMAQCHGSIELARRLKVIHPEALTMFGGLSATYYANELIRYSCVDLVVRGYDTLLPVTQIMQMVRSNQRAFDTIPNVVNKTKGVPSTIGFVHKPTAHYNDAPIDWSFYKHSMGDAVTSKMIMTLPNTGCAMDCGWCGGSKSAYKNIMGVENSLIHKQHRHILDELRSMGDSAETTSIYALQCYSESKSRLAAYLDGIKEMGYRKVFFEQYHLTSESILKKMSEVTDAYVMLSPESHDQEISRLAGRGNYSMMQMEQWITKALDVGISGVMVWFFIGMPQQTPESVMETVDYCQSLLEKFPDKNVTPLICPMVPFLDPGSEFFENPTKHGYRIFHRTLEEHRQAMVEPLWHRRLNYETDWLTRRQIQDVTYEAIGHLVSIKGDCGMLPRSVSKTILGTIEETQALLCEIERALEIDGVLPFDLRDSIRTYNSKILSFSSDQIIPFQRPFGGRWFDDFTIPPEIISKCTPAKQ